MAEAVQMYLKSSCVSCRKARAFLLGKGVKLKERDLAKEPLLQAELTAIIGDAHPKDFLNPKSPSYRKKKLGAVSLDREVLIRLMVEDPNLIKRPIIVKGKKMVVGFDVVKIKQLV
jgi:Spx/MgsR family transcriptional regulator